jgi:DNA-binding IclR family transcriptional regulator
LEQIKKQGYATEFAELGHLTACCSVPILDSQGNAVAAISLADIAESNENYLQMANDLKAAAAEISKIVAYTQN